MYARIQCMHTPTPKAYTCRQVPGANVYCWGSDAYGQAPPNLAARLSPVQLGASCCDGAEGNHCQCHVSDVAVWHEEAGVGQWQLRQSPVAVCTGGMHTCVLWANNRVSCFGCRGCLHNQTAVPPEIQGDAKAISCGLRHTCALLRTSGGIVCWGENQHGQAAAPVLVGAKQVMCACLFGIGCGNGQTLTESECVGVMRVRRNNPRARARCFF